MQIMKQWKVKITNWETAKAIARILRALAVKMKLMKPLPPPVDMQKKIVELTQKLQEECRKAGRMFCVECKRVSGLKYKYKDGSRGIVLRKITKGIYVCTDCLASKYGVTQFPKKGAQNDRTKEEGRREGGSQQDPRHGQGEDGGASGIPASGGQGETASPCQRAGGNDGEGVRTVSAGESREEGAGEA